jgi:hypothetical protein
MIVRGVQVLQRFSKVILYTTFLAIRISIRNLLKGCNSLLGLMLVTDDRIKGKKRKAYMSRPCCMQQRRRNAEC